MTTYEYDGPDNLTTIHYPSSRTVVSAYDAGNRVANVSDGGAVVYADGVTYWPSGAIRQFTAGNGIVHALTLDGRQRPLHLTAGVLDLTYAEYDGAGNLKTLTDSRPGFSQTFSYDNLDRLDTVASGPVRGPTRTTRSGIGKRSPG